MSVIPLLSRLSKLDIEVQLLDDKLKIDAPTGTLTPELLSELKDRKAEIIEFFKEKVRDRDGYTPLEPAPEKPYYVLTPAQRRLFFLQRMNPESTVYNISKIIPLDDPPDMEKLQNTFKRLIERHEAMRTSIEMRDGGPVQVIHPHVAFDVQRFEPAAEGRAAKEIARDFIRPFDLSAPPLLRVALVGEEGNDYLLIVDMHHIVSDAVSHEILIKDFTTLYNGKTPPPITLHYKDYAEWKNGDIHNDASREREKYWLNEFKGEIPLLNLPTDYPRPPVQSYSGDVVSFEVSREAVRALKEFALESGTTVYIVSLALFNILLARLTGQEDIIVGTTVAGRPHADLQDIIGMFVNTLVLRNYPSGEKTVKAFVAEVGRRTLAAFENQDYPFEELVEKVAVGRDVSRNPLFDVMFALQGMEEKKGAGAADDRAHPPQYSQGNRHSRFDMSWWGMERGESLSFRIEYCTKLFKRETVQRFADYFGKITAVVPRSPGLKLKEIDMVSQEERHRVLYEFNDTGVEYPREKTICRLFEEQVERTPDFTAVVFEDTALTYRALDRRAHRLAGVLVEKGMRPGTVAGIMVDRSVELMTGILAILKTGGAYLPMEVDTPRERVKYMLTDSRSLAVLTRGAFPADLPPGCENVDLGNTPVSSEPPPLPGTPAGAGDLAYATYTSGSTGRPKGVMVENRSVVNFIKGITDVVPFGPGDAILSLTTVTFDIFGLETILPLSKGAKVVIGNREEQLSPTAIASVLLKECVTVFQLTPSRLSILLTDHESAAALAGVDRLLVGGEKFPDPLLEKVKEYTRGRIYNVYGPTETTIWSTIKEVTADKVVNIGAPIANTQVYILSREGLIQPPGLTGELCIAGDGLSRGYLNQPVLTGEKFTPVPALQGKTVYRTGDMARWLPDGNIEFLGRIDNQLKIRGFRIELGEIEYQLLKHENIEDAVVIAKEATGGKILCAYFVAPGKIDVSQLRDRLSGELPRYMIPSYFMQVEKIPLTPSGKVNTRALPDVETPNSPHYTAPTDEIETKLVEMWSAILDVPEENIGIENNFFALGGVSLDLIMLVSEIHRECEIELPITQIYDRPVIKEIAKSVKSKKYVDEPVVQLNPSTPKKIFCFPSSIGIGINYLRLATLINDFTFYSFNFIEEKNRAEQYADIITKYQPTGPYILFGWSSPGGLIFEVTRELETRGHEVSDIIFADCFWIEKEKRKIEEAREARGAYLEDVAKHLEEMGAPFLKDKVIRKSIKYAEYNENLEGLEKVRANVHLILSTEERPEWMIESWGPLTSGDYKVYQGFGIHQHMIKRGAVEKNAPIIREILDGIGDFSGTP